VAITIKMTFFFLILVDLATNFNPEMNIQILDCNMVCKK